MPALQPQFDVKLSDKPLTIVQPDLLIICDKNKLDGKISDYLDKIFPEICGSLERNLK